MHLYKVGKGNISFRRSNWLAKVLNPLHSNRLTVRQGIEDHTFLQNVLSPAQFNHAMSVVIDDTKPDEMIFIPMASGKFQMKVYIEISKKTLTKVS